MYVFCRSWQRSERSSVRQDIDGGDVNRRDAGKDTHLEGRGLAVTFTLEFSFMVPRGIPSTGRISSNNALG